MRSLASRAPNATSVPEETRSNCWLQRLTFSSSRHDASLPLPATGSVGLVPLRPSHSVKSEPEGLYPHLARLIIPSLPFHESTKLNPFRCQLSPPPPIGPATLLSFFLFFIFPWLQVIGSRSNPIPDHRFRTPILTSPDPPGWPRAI